MLSGLTLLISAAPPRCSAVRKPAFRDHMIFFPNQACNDLITTVAELDGAYE
jgi:hypothetical protein